MSSIFTPALIAQKRAEAADYRRIALMASLPGNREQCLRRAEELEREASDLEMKLSPK